MARFPAHSPERAPDVARFPAHSPAQRAPDVAIFPAHLPAERDPDVARLRYRFLRRGPLMWLDFRHMLLLGGSLMVEIIRAGQILVPGLNLLHKRRAVDSLPLTNVFSLMSNLATIGETLFSTKKEDKRMTKESLFKNKY